MKPPYTYEELAGSGAVMGVCTLSLLFGLFAALPLCVRAATVLPGGAVAGKRRPKAALSALAVWLISGPLAIAALRTMFGFAAPGGQATLAWAAVAACLATAFFARSAATWAAGGTGTSASWRALSTAATTTTNAVDDENDADDQDDDGHDPGPAALPDAVGPGSPGRITRRADRISRSATRRRWLGAVVLPIAVLALGFSVGHAAQLVRSGAVFVSFWSGRRAAPAHAVKTAAWGLAVVAVIAATLLAASRPLAATLAGRVGHGPTRARLRAHAARRCSVSAVCAGLVAFSVASGSFAHFVAFPLSAAAQTLVVMAMPAAAMIVIGATVSTRRPFAPVRADLTGHDDEAEELQISLMVGEPAVRRRGVVAREGSDSSSSTPAAAEPGPGLARQRQRQQQPAAAGTLTTLGGAHVCVIAMLPGLSKRYLLAAAASILLVAVPIFMIVFMLSGGCFAIHPNEFTTLLSRSWSTSPCADGPVCHTYVTLAETADAFVIHGIVRREADLSTGHVAFAQHFELDASAAGPSTADPCGAADDVPAGSGPGKKRNIQTFPMRLTALDNVSEERRWLLFGVLPVTPGRRLYCARVAYARGTDAGSGPETAVASRWRLLRSLPAATDDGPVLVLAGGDMEVSRDPDDPQGFGAMTLRALDVAGGRIPDFAIIGGDIAYGNGLHTCYRRWDRWFNTWDSHAGRGGTAYLPITLCPGNHEAGGFGMSRVDMPFYLRFFLQSADPAEVAAVPAERSLPHAHRIGSFLEVVSLDSDISERLGRDAPQTRWLEARFNATDPWASTRVVFYHFPGWPSVPRWAGTRSGEIRDTFVPMFTQHGVDLVLEHHFHVYKRTAPIGADGRPLPPGSAERGFIVLGDGSWGVASHRIPAVASELVERVDRERAVFLIEARPNGRFNVSVVNHAGTIIDTVTR